MDESLVSGHNFWRDVDLSIVAHDRIESPEELARRILGLVLKLSAYLANGINGFSTWDVTGKHHVKVIQVRLLQSIPQVRNLLCRDSRSLPLPVSGMVACLKKNTSDTGSLLLCGL